MNNRSITAIFLLLTLSGTLFSQKTDEKIIMTVDNKPVTAGEFIRMYKKSYQPGNTNDLNDYAEQYSVFKLKVADAIHEGYDTTKGFRTELNGYRNQLAQTYLTDQETKEMLLRQAYQKLQTEINAWHILISLPPAANPEDTLKAWKKARDIRERIIQGESFEQVARSSSDDPSVKNNGGNLGYFTVFQMITPFEDAAYHLRKGEISNPVRSPYGYHIIQVADKRPSGGKIKVAHIMKIVPPGAPDNEIKAAEDTIMSVYRKLSEGALFETLAAEYSDHTESSSSEGELNWFGVGEISSDFAEAAFALKNKGDVSKPVKTIYGWHIIKLLDKKPLGSYDENRAYLESRLSETYLNSLSKKTFIEKLKKEYKLRVYQNYFDWFVDNTDTMIIKGISRFDHSSVPKGALYTFADQKLSNADFAIHIEKRGSMIETDDIELFIGKTLDLYLSDHIMNYENSILEKKYPEFRYLMDEFHDGILLFDISAVKVWNKAQTDSAGLVSYYDDVKNNFLTIEQIDAKVYLLKDIDGMKKLSSQYRKNQKMSDLDNILTDKFMHKGDSLLKISTGIWSRGEDQEMENFKWSEGLHQATIHGFPALVIIRKYSPSKPIPLEEIKGEIISGYQEFLEKSWIEQLKKKYTVKINTDVLEEVKKLIANE